MSTSFVSHALLLKNLFDKRFQYTIPLYQRPFSWTEQQSTKLFDDIVEAMGDEDEGPQMGGFFLGAMILTGHIAEPNKQAITGKLISTFNAILSGTKDLPDNIRGDFDVVDGKQRLVTLKILLCLLRDLSSNGDHSSFRDLIGDGGDGNRYRLVLCGGESDFLDRHVLNRGTSIQPVPLEENISDSERKLILVRDSLHRNLLDLSKNDRTRLLDYIVNHCQIVIILSEAIDHAYQIFLSINHDGAKLTDGDILKAQLMSNLSPDDIKNYKNIWEQWNDSLGEMRSKASSHHKTFFNHFRYVLTSYHINILSDLERMMIKAGGAKPFIDLYLKPNIDAYLIINNENWEGSPHEDEINNVLGLLNWLPHDDWMVPAMLAITRFKSEPAHLLAFLKKLERLAYGLLILPGGAADRKKKYNPLKRSLRDLNGKTDPFKVVEFSANEKKIINKIIERGLHKVRPAAARLLLLRLDMKQSGKSVAHYNALIEKEALSVEHFLPLSPQKNSQWLVSFPDERLRIYNTELFGNLFLVREKSENPKMKNYDFAQKHAILFKDGLDHPIYFTNELKPKTDWTLNDIAQRQTRLLEMVEKIWP